MPRTKGDVSTVDTKDEIMVSDFERFLEKH